MRNVLGTIANTHNLSKSKKASYPYSGAYGWLEVTFGQPYSQRCHPAVQNSFEFH